VYIGNDLQVAFPSYRNIDNISGSFNGVTTSFALLINGGAPVPPPLSSNQCLISVNGVIQKPDDTGASGFRLSGGNIIFSSAPAGGATFFGIVLAGADYVNAGVNFPDGSVGVPAITFDQDNDTGYYRSASGSISFSSNGVASGTWNSSGISAPALLPTGSTVPTNGIYLPSVNNIAIATNGTQRLLLDSTGQIESANLGSAASPAWSYVGDPNTGIFSPTADTLAITTGGSERLRVDSSGRLGLGTSSPSSILDVSSATAAGRTNVTFTNPAAGNTANRMRLRIGPSVGFVGTDFYPYIESYCENATSQVSGLAFGTFDANGVTGERVRIDSSGRVGIGVTPSAQLDVKATSGTLFRAEYTGIAQLNIGNGGNSINYYDGDTQIFRSGGGTERGRWDSSGRFLVGTSTSIPVYYNNNAAWDGVFQVSRSDQNAVANFTTWNSSASTYTTYGGVQLHLSACKSGTTGSHTSGALANGDTIGTITFNASDGTNFRNAARIEAVVDAASGTADVPGRLVFSTTADGASSPTERMRISQDGLVDIPGGSSGNYYGQTPTRLGVYNYNPSGTCTAHIYNATGNGTAANTYALRVSQNVDANGDTSAALRIDHSNPLGATGGALIQAFSNLGNSTTQRIWQVNSVGAQVINRPTGNGTLIDFQASQVSQGSISVSGTTVSYNAFLGSHWAVLSDWSRPEIEIGTILEAVNEIVIWKYALIDVDGKEKKICYNGNEAEGEVVTVEYKGQQYQGTLHVDGDQDFEKSIKVKVNDTAGSKAVYGVFVGWNAGNELDGGTWNDMYVGAVGNYVIRMAAGQTPEIGDLIEADGTGCGVVQDDDIIRTKTVGKITTTTPQVTYEDGSFLVTCVLYCG
jgi:hypothetical protein